MASTYDPLLGRMRKKDEGNGAPGQSAYQVAVSNGFAGTEAEWIASLKGVKGDTGETGSTGPQGPIGETGPQGSAGTPGTNGTNGSDGAPGYTPVKGVDYFDGATGPKGDKGDTGDAGPAGTTTWAGITDKPATFTPTSHNHTKADISDFTHTHDDRYYTEAEMDTLLSSKQASGDYATNTALTNGLATKANTSHSHAISDITATGTPSSSTYLRGDGSWSTPAGGGSTETHVVLSAEQANSTTVATAATGLSTVVAAGTYLFKYWICYRAAATTTGIEMYVAHTGTTSRLVSTWYTLTTGGAAATGVADQATTLTAQMMEGKGQRVSGVASGPTQGVDTANADQFAVMEGIMIVTIAGTLQFMFRSEVNLSAVTIMPGTTLTLTKVV